MSYFIEISAITSLNIPDVVTTLSEKLKLPVDPRLKTSRDSYATTLKRSGKTKDEIGEMMGPFQQPGRRILPCGPGYG